MGRVGIIILAAASCLLAAPVQTRRLTIIKGDDLQSIINYANDHDTLVLAAKRFEATREWFTEPLCGNCQDPQTSVRASFGFRIKGKSLVIMGYNRDSTVLVTNAGYGIYLEDSPYTRLQDLTITGGRRDASGDATDAAIVVRRSRAEIVNVNILDNDHRLDTVVVGIGGIFGREGAEISIRDCRIINNGWDGVALYRGAWAVISDCIIKDGRGAGIGVTWDATCLAYRNEISGYWKGIGAFGASWVSARNNLVHDNLGWGIIATGKAHMDVTNNILHHNGNCGIAPWGTESRGRIVNNIITANGWRDYWVCPCVGVWNYGDWAKWDFAHNLVWDNVDGNYEDIWDQTGLNGNISEDPLFVSDTDFRLQPGSPALHAGDSLIYNPDGSVSHIGIHGGPYARPK